MVNETISPSPARQRAPALLYWRLADDFGWGILGLNLFREWVRGGEVAPVAGSPIASSTIFQAPPEQRPLFEAAVRFSNSLSQELTNSGDGPVQVRMPVIRPLGNGLNPGRAVSGTKTIGRAIFEDTRVEAQKLAPFDTLLTACEWNANLLRAATGRPVQVIHEAIDHARFYPRPPVGLLPPGQFYIFTGGKIEYRKAQDLVLLAFKEFSRRHDDAVLVTAWHSPFTQFFVGFQGRLNAAVAPGEDGKPDILRWAADNGIAPEKVIDLGLVPNAQMPAFLSDMHCALQPSRAEAATNLVAMEAMAMGLPVIVARNTGMLDLIAEQNCIALDRQSVIAANAPGSVEGWGESDVEEIVEALERLYTSADLRRRIGAQASAFMQTRTWADHAQKLQQLLF